VGPFTPASIGIDGSDAGELDRVYEWLQQVYAKESRRRRRNKKSIASHPNGSQWRKGAAEGEPSSSWKEPEKEGEGGAPRGEPSDISSSSDPARAATASSASGMGPKMAPRVHTPPPSPLPSSRASREGSFSDRPCERREHLLVEEEEEEDLAVFSSLFSFTTRRMMHQTFPIGSTLHYTLLHVLHPFLWKQLLLWSAEGPPLPSGASSLAVVEKKRKPKANALEEEEEMEVRRRRMHGDAALHSSPLFLDERTLSSLGGASFHVSSSASSSFATVWKHFLSTLQEIQNETAIIEQELATLVPYLVPEHYRGIRILLQEVRHLVEAKKRKGLRARNAVYRHPTNDSLAFGPLEAWTRLTATRDERSSPRKRPTEKNQSEERKRHAIATRLVQRLRDRCVRPCRWRFQRMRQYLAHTVQESGWNVGILALEMALSDFDLRTESHLSPLFRGARAEEGWEAFPRHQPKSHDRPPGMPLGPDRTSLYFPSLPRSSFSSSSPSRYPSRTADVWKDIQAWVRLEHAAPHPFGRAAAAFSSSSPPPSVPDTHRETFTKTNANDPSHPAFPLHASDAMGDATAVRTADASGPACLSRLRPRGHLSPAARPLLLPLPPLDRKGVRRSGNAGTICSLRKRSGKRRSRRGKRGVKKDGGRPTRMRSGRKRRAGVPPLWRVCRWR